MKSIIVLFLFSFSSAFCQILCINDIYFGNQQVATSAVISIGDIIWGNLCAMSEEDWFVFTAPNYVSSINVLVMYGQSNGDIDTVLLDSQKNILASSSLATGIEMMQITASPGQNYYIGLYLINQPSSSGSPFNLTLTASDLASNSSVPMQTTYAKPLKLGGGGTNESYSIRCYSLMSILLSLLVLIL